jgi:hypothetical protein
MVAYFRRFRKNNLRPPPVRKTIHAPRAIHGAKRQFMSEGPEQILRRFRSNCNKKQLRLPGAAYIFMFSTPDQM